MRIQTMLNMCQKFKSFVYTNMELQLRDNKKVLIITVEHRKNSKPICSGCMSICSCYDHQDVREFEFVPLWGVPVYFSYHMRRVNCKQCGVKILEFKY